MKKKLKEIKLFFLKKKLNFLLNKFKKVSLRQKKYQTFLAKFKETKSYFYLQTSKKYFLLILFTSTFTSSVFYFYWKNKHSISIAIWTDYLTDEVIDKFKEETGWNVNVVTFSSNGELLNKLNSTKFDVIMPSDFTVPELYKYGFIQPFDIKKIKEDQDNFSKNEIDNYFYQKLIYNDTKPTMFQNLNFFDDVGKEKFFVQHPGSTESFYYPFYPGTIQFAYNKDMYSDPDAILKKYGLDKNDHFSLWKALREAMKDKNISKPILFSDDPRNSFGFTKTLRLIDCASKGKNYSEECKEFFPYYTKNNETQAKNDYLNFQTPLDVIKSFELLKDLGINRNVKFVGDEIATNLSDKAFSIGFIYNGAISYAIQHKNNSIEGINFNKFLFCKDCLKDANVPFYTDGFVLGSNLSKEKKEISEKFISFATSYYSGYSTLKNYSFPTLNFASIKKYVKEKFKTGDTSFLSNLLMFSTGELDTSSFSKFISDFEAKFDELQEIFRLYTYNLDDLVNNYYNLFLTDKGAQD
ncbi:extracellular solute-binding protein [symbiont of Argiope bruennichi]|uniref:extracellular solute-binding protein n=1 Tax=symbiont of Argiope bruennichi TaxID=2810479 RepID=UPI003DA252DB